MIIRKGSVQRFAITPQLNMTEKINSAGLVKAFKSWIQGENTRLSQSFLFIEFRYKTAEIAS